LGPLPSFPQTTAFLKEGAVSESYILGPSLKNSHVRDKPLRINVLEAKLKCYFRFGRSALPPTPCIFAKSVETVDCKEVVPATRKQGVRKKLISKCLQNAVFCGRAKECEPAQDARMRQFTLGGK
jgi:hypothetical protein